MTDPLSRPSPTPGVMDIDRYAVVAAQGVTLVAILDFIAAAVISVTLAAGTWYPGAVALYKIAGLVPCIPATILAGFVGPRVWRRLVVDGLGFSALKGAVAGAVTVAVVQIITIEMFLAVAFGFLWLSDPGAALLGTFPNQIVMAPLSSAVTVGVFTFPTGTLIGLAVAIWCQRLLKAGRRAT